jgi:hypothetical protein
LTISITASPASGGVIRGLRFLSEICRACPIQGTLSELGLGRLGRHKGGFQG